MCCNFQNTSLKPFPRALPVYWIQSAILACRSHGPGWSAASKHHLELHRCKWALNSSTLPKKDVQALGNSSLDIYCAD